MNATLTLQVMQLGSPIIIGESIPARIVGIAIDIKMRITYRCAWWDGRTRHSEWLEQCEVLPTNGTQIVKMGFHDGRH